MARPAWTLVASALVISACAKPAPAATAQPVEADAPAPAVAPVEAPSAEELSEEGEEPPVVAEGESGILGAMEAGDFVESPYGGAFAASGDADVWGGPTKGKPVPKVRQGKHRVDGPLDSDIIRRIVRAHINEIRSCYSEGLKRWSELNGSFTIEFTIALDGTVSASAAMDAQAFPDPAVPKCAATAVLGWKFPKPQGSEVEVRYPFEVEPPSR